MRSNSGFTLIELMIAVAIVALLMAIAIPSYQNAVTKSRRSDGKAALMELAARLEKYYYKEKTYTTDLSALGYTKDSNNNYPTPEGFYSLSISAATTECEIAYCYKLVAEAIGAHNGDPNLEMNSYGQKLPADLW